MIKYDIEQRSEKWFELRKTIPTASSFNKILNHKGLVSSQFNNYLEQIKYPNAEPKIITTDDIQRGIDYEDEALQEFEFLTGIETAKIGFVTDDDKKAGASPDAVIINNINDQIISGVEIKCPRPNNHYKYKEANKCPNQYYPQVMGTMAICGVNYWYFVSYCVDDGDIFIKKIERNQEWINRFFNLIDVFNSKLVSTIAIVPITCG